MNDDLGRSNSTDLMSFFNRTITGIIFVAVVLFSLLIDTLQTVFAVIVSVMALIGTWEYYTIARRKGLFPLPLLGFLLGAAILLDAWLYAFDHLIPILVISVMLALIAHILRLSYQGAVTDTAINMFGAWYVALPVALMLYMVRNVTDGKYFVAFLLGIVWMTDTGAYIVGKHFGIKKITPRLSPKKTVAGVMGGIITAVLVGILIWVFWEKFAELFSLKQVITLSLLLSIIGQIGDLAESALKRDAELKDSGITFTAHGGILDIIDSLLFCAPVTYLYILSVFPLYVPAM